MIFFYSVSPLYLYSYVYTYILHMVFIMADIMIIQAYRHS